MTALDGAVEVMVPPNATAEALAYLRAQLEALGDPAAVERQIPDPRPARLVKVAVAGGNRLDLVRYRAVLLVECWDERDDLAHDLAAVCYGLLFVMPYRHNGAEVYKATEVAGLVPLPDPDTAAPRWTFTIALDFRASALPG